MGITAAQISTAERNSKATLVEYAARSLSASTRHENSWQMADHVDDKTALVDDKNDRDDRYNNDPYNTGPRMT